MSIKENLTKSEKTILRELIFQEPFEHLITETGYTYGTIRDDLIKLINHSYIEVFDTLSGQSISPFYDSDKIQQFSFKATKTGLKSIQDYGI
jgi:hypothetical protein